jgi:hypothetical protein
VSTGTHPLYGKPPGPNTRAPVKMVLPLSLAGVDSEHDAGKFATCFQVRVAVQGNKHHGFGICRDVTGSGNSAAVGGFAFPQLGAPDQTSLYKQRARP